MTPRGSLAYYLAAWVCGCFFVSVTIWIGNEARPVVPGSVPLLLYIYFLSLMFGAIASLLFGFVLRLAAYSFRWGRVWHWLLAGAVLAPALLAALGSAPSAAFANSRSWRLLISAISTGPHLIRGGRPWIFLLTAPAGAATAWVLFRVHRAFTAPQNEF